MILLMIKVGKVGSNPLLIHRFFEHGRRERMTIFWIFPVYPARRATPPRQPDGKGNGQARLSITRRIR